MSWQTLTGAGGVTVKYSNEEVERVKQLCETLGIENEQLRVEKDSLLASRKVLKEQVLEKEQARQALQKKLNKSEINLKLETKARDGISKKVNKFEYEMLNYKDECANMKEELGMLRAKVSELTYNLNQERAKRLRDIHEMDILKRKNTELEASNHAFGKDNQAALTSLYEKLEKMDTVMTHNESQKRVISSMGTEVNTLNSEVAMVKEDLRRSQEQKYKIEKSLSLKDRERALLEAEVFRLRKELIGFSGTHGQRQKAFELSGMRHSAGLGGGELMTLEDPFAFADLGPSGTGTRLVGDTQAMAMQQAMQQQVQLPSRGGGSTVVSSASVPYAIRSNVNKSNNDAPVPPTQQPPPSSQEGKRHQMAPFSAPLLQRALQAEVRASASTSEVMGASSGASGMTNGSSRESMKKQAKKGKGLSMSQTQTLSASAPSMCGAGSPGKSKNRTQGKSKSGEVDFALTPKSRFTGAGLGMRRGETLEFQPQGSAKQIIRQALKEQRESES